MIQFHAQNCLQHVVCTLAIFPYIMIFNELDYFDLRVIILHNLLLPPLIHNRNNVFYIISIINQLSMIKNAQNLV